MKTEVLNLSGDHGQENFHGGQVLSLLKEMTPPTIEKR
jgi:hypothetical protein